MKKFKKIYIEITNTCNLSCSFCGKDHRVKESITLERFELILKTIDDYTDYIYLHVKGEPLLHPQLQKILNVCEKYHKQVNITTNGTLLKEKENELAHPIVRQINISLHSENNKENYLEEIFQVVDNLTDKIIIFRFWTMKDNRLDKKSTEIVDSIVKYYHLSPEIVEKIKIEKHVRINNHIYVDKANEFIWPSLDNDYHEEKGFCYALKDQLAILVDGTVVPCCLDGEGIMKLGNVYEDSMENILNSKKFQEMRNGFCNRKVTEELCKHCSFKNGLLVNQDSKLISN